MKKSTNLPLDIWVKLFDESDIKEKIRILSTNKEIRNHIYDMYGGKQVVYDILQKEKMKIEINQLNTILQYDSKEIDFDYIIEILESYSLDPNDFRDKKTGETILMKACQANDSDTVRRLLSMNVDVNAQDKRLRTALMYACHGYRKMSRGRVLRGINLDIVEMLLNSNADMMIEDDERDIALQYSMENPDFNDVVELFENAGMDQDEIDDIRDEARSLIDY
jgi:ankyrin repeat protein